MTSPARDIGGTVDPSESGTRPTRESANVPASGVQDEVVGRVRTPRTIQRMRRNKAALVSLAFLIFIVLVGLFSGWIAPQDPHVQDLLQRLQGPNSSHWLGTDSLGRDNFSRLIEGTTTTLRASLIAITLAVVAGLPAGLLAGYSRGWIDHVLNWISDVFLAVPPLILALTIVGVLGPGLTNAMLAVGVVLAPRFFRVARAAAVSVRNETYIEASRATGCSGLRILFRHVLPNASGPIIVQLTFSLGIAVSSEASLSFLGLGTKPPTASWGSMVRDAFDGIYDSRLPLVAPSLMIILTVMGFSILGDALRDALGRQSRVGD